MRTDENAYNEERAAQCRSMAQLAANNEIRRRHEELAALHANRAATIPTATPATQLGA